MKVTHLSCCALTEIDQLSQGTFKGHPAKALAWFLHVSPTPILGGPRSMILFSGAHPDKDVPAKYAEDFKNLLTKNKLGKVYELPPVKNKNSDNYVTVYVWVVNQKTTLTWKNKHPWPVSSRV